MNRKQIGFGVRLAGRNSLSLWVAHRGKRNRVGLMLHNHKACILVFLTAKTSRRLATWLTEAAGPVRHRKESTP